MYSTCLFCHGSLGANEVVEQFPVGRRLAFDGSKGRLWVICRKCGGWNLTPIEERWEAIEECERRFRDSKLRVSTDHIGMTKLPEGLELVRIGNPLRPELAMWRYARRLTHRRWRTGALYGGSSAAVFLGSQLAFGAIGAAVGVATHTITLGSSLLVPLTMRAWVGYRDGIRTALRVPDDNGIPIKVTRLQALHADIDSDVDGAGWTLLLPKREDLFKTSWDADVTPIRITGPAALRAAGLILPSINLSGTRKHELDFATQLLEERGADRLFRDLGLRADSSIHRLRRPRKDPSDHDAWIQGRQAARDLIVRATIAGRGMPSGILNRGPLQELPRPLTLALEMAAHEEMERRALEGDLAELETAWREAEEIAAISDNMFLPQSVGQFFERQRQTPPPPSP